MIPETIRAVLDSGYLQGDAGLVVNRAQFRGLREEIEKALADARDEALEACIKIAQDMVCTHSPIGPLHGAGWTGAANAIEEKIRALKGKP